jgi:hypothetical protein
MKTFVIKARVSGTDKVYDYERHTNTAREALKSFFEGAKGKPLEFLGIREYAGSLKLWVVV